MSLSRALFVTLIAVAVSFGLSMGVSASVEDPDFDAGPQVAEVVWEPRPNSVNELADETTVLVEAEVIGIETGPDLVSQSPADSAAEHAIPTQRILFSTLEVLSGQAPSTFKLFKTGSPDMHLKGDPLYRVGERYVLFLEPHGESGTYIPSAPDGRVELDAHGQADPVIGGPVAAELEGKTTEQIERVAE